MRKGLSVFLFVFVYFLAGLVIEFAEDLIAVGLSFVLVGLSDLRPSRKTPQQKAPREHGAWQKGCIGSRRDAGTVRRRHTQ